MLILVPVLSMLIKSADGEYELVPFQKASCQYA